ncbi:MAG: hypothetical protein HOW97_02580 [Catenulispora sp.]|nr:hypothetical protein [Catenulispora sp.]
MPALNLRDARLLARALDAAAEELDLPLTSRQVQALAQLTARRLAEVAVQRPPVPGGFRPPDVPPSSSP